MAQRLCIPGMFGSSRYERALNLPPKWRDFAPYVMGNLYIGVADGHQVEIPYYWGER